MNVRHDLPLRRPVKTNGARAGSARTRVRRSRLAETLTEARFDKGLELRELSVITGVRMSHLEALEAGDYGQLPADAKGKTAVRLFARAVGLEPARMLLLYTQERRGVYAPPPPDLELPQDNTRALRPVWGQLGRWLATLALVAATLGGSLWAFNALLFPPVSPASTLPTTPLTAPSTTGAPQPSDAPVDLATADVPVRPPPTADVRPMAPLPTDAPPVPRAPSTSVQAVPSERSGAGAAQPTALTIPPAAPVRGVATQEATQETVPPQAAPLDAAEGAEPEDAALESVTPEATPPDEVAAQSAGAESRGVEGAAPSPPAGLTLSITEAAWLEVYTGASRREGERLVYRIAEAGETLSFDPPVFVFTGNAGGVSVSVSGEPAEPLGIPSAVVGRAFTE